MQLEQIRDKAYSDAIRKVPNPSFGASIHEYGETEQEVLNSIDDRFRDEVFIRSMELLHEKRPKYRYESPEGYYFELTEAFKSAGASLLIFRDAPWSTTADVAFTSAERTGLSSWYMTIHTNLKNIRNDLIDRPGSH